MIATHERLLTHPAFITVDGNEIPVTGFAEQVRMMLTSRSEIGRVPMFITAFASGDYSVIRPFIAQILATPLDKFPNQALYMTMVCPADISTDSMRAAQAEYASPQKNTI